jgi:hypothetical protein
MELWKGIEKSKILYLFGYLAFCIKQKAQFLNSSFGKDFSRMSERTSCYHFALSE